MVTDSTALCLGLMMHCALAEQSRATFIKEDTSEGQESVLTLCSHCPEGVFGRAVGVCR